MRRLLVPLLALVVAIAGAGWAQGPAEPVLELHFLDVGQGDSVLIRSPSGQTVLYDGGRGRLDALAHLRRLGVERIDLVIASHPDADHIGGLVEVVRRYRPRFFMDNGQLATTRVYADLLAALREAGSAVLEPTGQRIGLGDAALQVLPPPGVGDDRNANSVGAIVAFGSFRAGLTGDAERTEFAYWATRHRELLGPVQVYKASHHGSQVGDTPLSMQLFHPEVVVIGVGESNPYGHPTPSALRLYAAVGARVFRTDRHGTVVVRARRDGTYRVRTERSAPSVPEPERVPPPAAPAPAGPGYDPLGPDRDCGDFRTHAEAQAFFRAAGGPARDPHRLDGDGNGEACESLP